MKIFNLQPIRVNEYQFNEAHLAESRTSSSYESGFTFECEVVDSLKTMTVTFEILYTVGGIEWQEKVVLSDDPNKWTIQVSGMETEDGGEIFISYKSSCRFNLENEGSDADVISMTDFLSDYNKHTQTFLNQYGFEPSILIEKLKTDHDLEDNARCAIENLRGNNMYEF